MTDTSIPLKQCSRKENCVNPLGSWLSATDKHFYRDNRVKSGLVAQCKVCIDAKNTAYQKQHPDVVRRRGQRYRAKYPEKNRDRQRAYRHHHLEQCREYHRRYRRIHPERDAASIHKRRSQKLGNGGTYTAEDVRVMIAAQTDKRGHLRCWWCGRKIKGRGFHIDHRIPLARGGSNAPDNLCIACPNCNISKGAKLPQEWNGRLL